MNRTTIAGSVFAALLMVSMPALAQTECENEGDIFTQASCDGDVCSCAAPCSQNSECRSQCCNSGFCALRCVCEGQGTVTLNCAGAGGCGCGTVATTVAPVGGGMAMLWGFGFIGVGLIASGRFIRRSGLRSPAAVASLSLALLGATFVAATAFEKAPVAQSKSLAQR